MKKSCQINKRTKSQGKIKRTEESITNQNSPLQHSKSSQKTGKYSPPKTPKQNPLQNSTYNSFQPNSQQFVQNQFLVPNSQLGQNSLGNSSQLFGQNSSQPFGQNSSQLFGQNSSQQFGLVQNPPLFPSLIAQNSSQQIGQNSSQQYGQNSSQFFPNSQQFGLNSSQTSVQNPLLFQNLPGQNSSQQFGFGQNSSQQVPNNLPFLPQFGNNLTQTFGNNLTPFSTQNIPHPQKKFFPASSTRTFFSSV